MSTQENKLVVRRYFEEMLNQGRLEVAHELFAADYGSGAAEHPELVGPQRAAHAAQALRRAFPDIHFTVEHLLAEGDEVAVYVSFSGTHQGSFMGLPATGKRATVHGAEQARLKDGRIVAAVWHLYDLFNSGLLA